MEHKISFIIQLLYLGQTFENSHVKVTSIHFRNIDFEGGGRAINILSLPRNKDLCFGELEKMLACYGIYIHITSERKNSALRMHLLFLLFLFLFLRKYVSITLINGKYL